MEVHEIDNSIDEELDRTILWQYENATNLQAVIGLIGDLYRDSTKNLWDRCLDDLSLDSDEQTDFGLSVIGILLGAERGGLDSDTYRNFLKGRYFIMRSNGSLEAINRYLGILFNGKVECVDGFHMDLTYQVKAGSTLTSEEQKLFDMSDAWKVYPAGVLENVIGPKSIFGFSEQNTNRAESDPIVVAFGSDEIDSSFYKEQK